VHYLIHFPGLYVLIFSGAAYLLSWYYFKQSRQSASLGCILFASLLLKVFCSGDPVLHQWDEQFHALVAKHLIKYPLRPALYEHPVLPYNFTDWTGNYIWLHKQPLSLWLIAASLKCFGISAFAVRIPSIVLSTLGILLVYSIANKWFDKRIAYVSALLCSFHGLIIELSSGRVNTDHPDVIFLFFILLAVWLITIAKDRLIYYAVLAGFALGCSILTKWLSAMIVLPLAAILIQTRYADYRKTIGTLLCIIIVAVLVVMPWQLYITSNFAREAAWEYAYNARHFSEPLEGHTGNFFYHFDQLRIIYGETIYIAVTWFTYKTFRQRTIALMLTSIWFWIPFLFFSLAATRMPAYTLIAGPAIFMITAVSCYDSLRFANQAKKYKWLPKLIAASFIVLPVRYAIERIKPFADNRELKMKAEELKQRKKLVRGATVFLNDPDYIQTMFFTNATSYPYIPADTIVARLEKNYHVVVLGSR